MNAGERFDVAVIGGGVMGLACAWRMAEAGARVALFERHSVGRQAGWAAGGMLAPQCEDAHHPPGGENRERRETMFALCRASRKLYPSFLRELEAASGCTVEASIDTAEPGDPRTPGFLYVCRDARDPAPAAFAAQKARGLRVEERNWNGMPAFWLPNEGQVENRDLVTALRQAALNTGVSLFENQTVAGMQRLTDGYQLMTAARSALCDRVLLCAGAWSGQINGWPGAHRPPVFPVKGQVLAVRMAEPPPHVLYSGNIYLIPRRDGRVLIGATVEHAGFDTTLSEVCARQLLQGAAAVWPGCAGASIEEHWAGLRPATPDGLPILGRTGDDHLFVACGHYRNGILLTPVTAQLMAACILKGADADPYFGLERFAAGRVTGDSEKAATGVGTASQLCA